MTSGAWPWKKWQSHSICHASMPLLAAPRYFLISVNPSMRPSAGTGHFAALMPGPTAQ